MPSLASIAEQELSQLEQQHRRRYIVSVEQYGVYCHKDGKKLLSFASNDYFGLAQHKEVKQAAIDATSRYGAGAGASRLLSGNYPLYETLEAELAEYKRTEAACVFGSGYLANLGVISHLAGPRDLVICDKLSHACIYDGIRTTKALWKRFRHNDTKHLDYILRKMRDHYRRCFIITESVFSMDGDCAPLQEMTQLAKDHDAWVIVDDAHGLSIVPHHPGVDLTIGTLSKGLGSYGGYVAGPQSVIDWIKSKARSLIYSTALPPAAIGASLKSLTLLRQEPQRVDRVMRSARLFCSQMGLPHPTSPIVPYRVGSEPDALGLSQQLEEEGVYAPCIRPPTVPPGTSRLRLSFSYNHTLTHVNQLIRTLHNAYDSHLIHAA